MDRTELVARALELLSGQGNPESAKGGNQSRKQGREPATGVITLSLGDKERLEARYWENPVKDTDLTYIGYMKPRLTPSSNGKDRELKSFRLSQALTDIEATYRVCERALERDKSKLISLTEDDRKGAEQVVSALSECFASSTAGLSGLANGQGDLRSLLEAIIAGA